MSKRAKECPIHRTTDKVRQVESDYKGLEKWVCDRCKIAWYLPPGKGTGDILRRHNPAVFKINLENAKKAYLPHVPKPVSPSLRRRHPGYLNDKR